MTTPAGRACSASQYVHAKHDCVARSQARARDASRRNRGSPVRRRRGRRCTKVQRITRGSRQPQRLSGSTMGAGSSLPSEYKQKITAAFQIKNTQEWRNAEDFDDELEMRNELMNLRALAAELVKDDRRKSTVYVQPTEKSLAVKKMLHAAMATNPLFKRCRTPEKEEMLGAFKFVHFDEKHVIIQQGDRGDEFYVLESGTVEFHVESRGRVGACGMGRGFGELALMYNTPRSASCIAATECTAWTLDRSTFRAILAKHAKKRALAYKELLKKVILNKDKHFMGPSRPLTDCITEAQLTKLAGAMDEE